MNFAVKILKQMEKRLKLAVFQDMRIVTFDDQISMNSCDLLLLVGIL